MMKKIRQWGYTKLHKRTWNVYEKYKDTEEYEQRVRQICLAWIKFDEFYANDNAYDYGGMDWKSRFEYCSDRMNGGRAVAILRLIDGE